MPTACVPVLGLYRCASNRCSEQAALGRPEAERLCKLLSKSSRVRGRCWALESSRPASHPRGYERFDDQPMHCSPSPNSVLPTGGGGGVYSYGNVTAGNAYEELRVLRESSGRSEHSSMYRRWLLLQPAIVPLAVARKTPRSGGFPFSNTNTTCHAPVAAVCCSYCSPSCALCCRPSSRPHWLDSAQLEDRSRGRPVCLACSCVVTCA